MGNSPTSTNESPASPISSSFPWKKFSSLLHKKDILLGVLLLSIGILFIFIGFLANPFFINVGDFFISGGVFGLFIYYAVVKDEKDTFYREILGLGPEEHLLEELRKEREKDESRITKTLEIFCRDTLGLNENENLIKKIIDHDEDAIILSRDEFWELIWGSTEKMSSIWTEQLELCFNRDITDFCLECKNGAVIQSETVEVQEIKCAGGEGNDKNEEPKKFKCHREHTLFEHRTTIYKIMHNFEANKIYKITIIRSCINNFKIKADYIILRGPLFSSKTNLRIKFPSQTEYHYRAYIRDESVHKIRIIDLTIPDKKESSCNCGTRRRL